MVNSVQIPPPEAVLIFYVTLFTFAVVGIDFLLHALFYCFQLCNDIHGSAIALLVLKS